MRASLSSWCRRRRLSGGAKPIARDDPPSTLDLRTRLGGTDNRIASSSVRACRTSRSTSCTAGMTAESASTWSIPTTGSRSTTAARRAVFRRSTRRSPRAVSSSPTCRYLLLSHIHLDHAGATGSLVREHPDLTVHISEIGAPHLVDPTRLEASARRLYGDAFDALWGELAPVPEANIRVVESAAVGLERLPEPRVMPHTTSPTCTTTGRCTPATPRGIRVAPGRFVFPPTPPPEIDLVAWERTLDEIERRASRRARPDPLRRLRRRRAPPRRRSARR